MADCEDEYGVRFEIPLEACIDDRIYSRNLVSVFLVSSPPFSSRTSVTRSLSKSHKSTLTTFKCTDNDMRMVKSCRSSRTHSILRDHDIQFTGRNRLRKYLMLATLNARDVTSL